MVANLFKYLFGFILALAILAGSSVAATLYFMNQSSRTPPKPIYANDEPEVRAKAGFDVNKTPSTGAATPSPARNNQQASKPVAKPTPEATEKATTEAKPLPPGAYNARVTWPQGLSLRSEPRTEAERVGGAGFKQKVIVIEESDDKVWQKVRLEGSNEEGWVKAGNTQKDDGQDNQQNNQDNTNNDNQNR
ncbi:SH3 type 3 domain-containing protein [Calothrix sp. NIES-4071]|nr:SH3 type 3 domain-containing protein [Calothrix sp. NIES-4071]BAZ63528.1 SH3 type 3 domain-containing protein [Calothrix sp. NIES-4105]